MVYLETATRYSRPHLGSHGEIQCHILGPGWRTKPPSRRTHSRSESHPGSNQSARARQEGKTSLTKDEFSGRGQSQPTLRAKALDVSASECRWTGRRFDGNSHTVSRHFHNRSQNRSGRGGGGEGVSPLATKAARHRGSIHARDWREYGGSPTALAAREVAGLRWHRREGHGNREAGNHGGNM